MAALAPVTRNCSKPEVLIEGDILDHQGILEKPGLVVAASTRFRCAERDHSPTMAVALRRWSHGNIID